MTGVSVRREGVGSPEHRGRPRARPSARPRGRGWLFQWTVSGRLAGVFRACHHAGETCGAKEWRSIVIHWSLSCGCRHAALVGLLLGAMAAGGASEPAIWRDATPATPIDHAVMVRNLFMTGHVKVPLEGPRALVTPDPAAKDTGSFNVYRITAVEPEEPRTVGVGIDPASLHEVRLGPAEFLLVPTHRLTDGAAAAAELVESVYEVRPLLETPSLDGIAAAGHAAGRPTHLCLAVDYKHHFERIRVRDANRGLLLFPPTAADEAAADISVVDDFGTNRLVPGNTIRAGVGVVVSVGAAP